MLLPAGVMDELELQVPTHGYGHWKNLHMLQ
jgi:hypothetical protein